MNILKKALHSKKIIAAAVTLLVLAAILAVACIWLGDYYPADAAVIEACAAESQIPLQTAADGTVSLVPEGATKGFIFYPGGKVEHTAYLPLMYALAEEGILCVLVEMPLRLAVLDMAAADGIRERYPAITEWYVGGHSLGGAMAASYLSEHTDDFRGLVLLGAYSTADLSDSSPRVLSVYGSEDRVMNREKYEKNKGNLPQGFTELVLEGGCHAYFGAYGPQKGDGTPTVTREEQTRATARAIAAMIHE